MLGLRRPSGSVDHGTALPKDEIDSVQDVAAPIKHFINDAPGGVVNLPTKRESASKPIRKPSTGPMPFVAISGAVSTFPPSWTTPAERKAALGRWVR